MSDQGFFIFQVDGEPVPWERARAHGKVFFTAKRTRDHQAKIKAAALRSGVKPLVGPVFVYINVYRSTRRRVDLDNLGKTVLDALNKIAYGDDSQICDLLISKRHDPDNPRTVVQIRSLTDGPQL